MQPKDSDLCFTPCLYIILPAIVTLKGPTEENINRANALSCNSLNHLRKVKDIQTTYEVTRIFFFSLNSSSVAKLLWSCGYYFYFIEYFMRPVSALPYKCRQSCCRLGGASSISMVLLPRLFLHSLGCIITALTTSHSSDDCLWSHLLLPP